MYYFACPSCTNNSKFYRVRRESGSSTPGFGLFIFGGVLASLMFMSYERRRRVQCGNCGFILLQPPIGQSPVAQTCVFLLLSLVVSAVIGVFFEVYPELGASLPGWDYVVAFAAYGEEHSVGLASAVTVGVLLMITMATLISLVSNWRFRGKIKSQFEHRATELPPMPDVPETQVDPPGSCPKCDYDLTGNISGVCPECGTNIGA